MPAKPKDGINPSDYVLDQDDELPSERRRREGKGKERPPQTRRLQRMPVQFVRVPIQWITQRRRGEYWFPPAVRLHLYLLHHSRWGQRGVAVTDAFLAEIEVARKTAYSALVRWEETGQIRIERRPGHALVVWPSVLAG